MSHLKKRYRDSQRAGRSEFESRSERDFPRPSRPALGPTQSPVQWAPSLFLGDKAAGHGVDHPLPSSADVKERVELYLYSPSESSWPVLG